MSTPHYAVITADKQKGSGGGLSAHIERQRWDDEQKKIVPYQPESVRFPERTTLNKEYLMAPGSNRTEAIENRIKEAGITRKIRDDAVKAICFICTSDRDKMAEIERNGQLDQWANDCIRYLQKEFGEKNVVAAALHMDEKTPHLHVTVVPVVEGQAKERKKRPKLDENGKPIDEPHRKIRKQQVTARLCAKDIMTQESMSRWQTEFAKVMEKYGMKRGIVGSQAERVDPKEYNDELKRNIRENKALQEDISFLRRELSEGYEISYEREKKWLSEFARAEGLENKVEQMKQQIEKLQQERQLMKEQIEAMKQERLQELEQEQEQHHSRGRGR